MLDFSRQFKPHKSGTVHTIVVIPHSKTTMWYGDSQASTCQTKLTAFTSARNLRSLGSRNLHRLLVRSTYIGRTGIVRLN